MYKEPIKYFKFEKKLYLKTFLIALLVSAAFFLPFVIGDRGIFLFYGDYNVQQIPFYQLAHRAIREGSFGFNFYTDLGVNFIGSYSFYLLGSPFFWLTLPFPNAALPYLMAPLFCLKFAVAATTGCAYIRRFVSKSDFAMIGGLLYAFSGFGIYNIFFNHFHEVIAFFPLLLLSLEEYVMDGRRGFFAFSVFLCALCNYFFFVGEVVFVIIYFFVRLASSKTWRLKFSSFLGLAFEAIVGLGLSMFLLMPSIVTVLGNPRVDSTLSGWSLLTYYSEQRYFAILECLFFPPDIPARPNFFPDANAKWSSLGAWLPTLGMCGVITFMQTHKKHFIRRILGISLVMALVPGLNSIFYAFNDAYYGRWFYMPILLMALATVISLERCTDKELNTGIRWSLGITLAFCAVGLVPKKTDEGRVEFGLTPYPERFWVYVIIALVSILLTVLAVNVWRKRKNFTKVLAFTVCLTTVVYAFAFISMGKSHSYDEDFIIDQAIYGSQNISLEAEKDEFYRIDVYEGMDNLPMFWGLPSIQAFHSIVPESVMTMYPELGIERGVGSRPESEHYALRTLTGCKYLFIESNREEKEVCFGFEKIDSQNGFDIYLNEYYVPMGWTYEQYCTTEEYNTTAEDYRARLMLQAICLSDEQIEKYGKYMVEHDRIDSFLSQSTMQEDTALLKENCADSFIVTNKGFESSITLDKPNLVFYSVPYDDGWSATVNGKKVDLERVNSGFVAVLCDAGENEIVFTYTTPGLYVGIIISIISFVLLLGYLIIVLLYRKKHPIGVQSEPDAAFDEISQMLSEQGNDTISLTIHSASEVLPKGGEELPPLRFSPEEEETEQAQNEEES
ncbi:MAG: YfhO family protein [Oscillospiraceae bacterium]|nr:YfhO family protein [Oscillospiraceae bacterium]